MEDLYLAFDIGTTGTKAALLAPNGDIVAAAYEAYETFRRSRGIAEQRAQDWWQAVHDATQKLAGHDLSRVTNIVLTGQMQNLTLLGHTGQPLRATILYSDTRATTEAAEVNTRLGAARLRQLTGNDQDASSLLAKLLWLRRHEPDMLKGAKHMFLGAADLIAHRLTGEAVSDATTASTTGLMDLSAREMLPEALFESLGLGDVIPLLPRVCFGGEQVGVVTLDAARKQLGLLADIPVHLGPGDAGATTVGAGSGEPGSAYGYIGTSGWVGFSAERRADPATGAFTLAHPHPTRFIQVAPLLTAGGNLRWVRDLFEASADNSFNDVVEQALSRQPGALLYLPYLNGERSPIRDPHARGAFVGLSSRTTKADLYRAVLEGVIYAYRHALEALVTNGLESLVLTGGGSKSPGWCQLFATIIGVRADIIEQPENVGLRGAQVCARVAAGKAVDYQVSHQMQSFEPDGPKREHYHHMFDRYLQLYPALRETFNGLITKHPEHNVP